MKRYNWGWRIVTAFIIFTTGTISWVTYAMTTEVDLVRVDYYEHGLKQDETAAAQARGLASRTAVEYDAASHTIRLTIPQQDVRGTISFYRPNAPVRDRQFTLVLDEHGAMQIPVSRFDSGLWHITVDWNSRGTTYELLKSYTF